MGIGFFRKPDYQSNIVNRLQHTWLIFGRYWILQQELRKMKRRLERNSNNSQQNLEIWNTRYEKCEAFAFESSTITVL